MTLEEIYFVSQTIGSIAVVASLVYLALQTRQASRNQLAQMHLGRLDQQLSDVFGIGGNADLAAVSTRGWSGDSTLNDGEVTRFAHWMFGRFFLMEEQFLLHKDRMISDERWRSTETSLKLTLTSPGTRAACRLFQPASVSKEFSTLLDRLMIEARSIPQVPLADAWKALAREEQANLGPSTP
jgi:hypothetical protein